MSSEKNKRQATIGSKERSELNLLVNTLLQATSESSTIPPAKAWQLHLTVNNLLEKINGIEKVIEKSLPVRNPDAIDDFINWMKKNGADIDNTEVSTFENVGFGLKATKPINQGSLVLSVPRSLMLTSESVQTSPLKNLWEVDPIIHNMPNIALALLLLLHLYDQKSFWSPYINVLPNSYDTVMYFTPEELEFLKGSPNFEKALKHCRSIARHYAYFYNLFQNSSDPVSQIFQQNFTYNSYRWAVSTVMTRQNAIPPVEGGETAVHALIPYWDMCNHTNAPMTTDYSVERGRCECFAFRDFAPGDEVTISYGGRPNGDLFLHNGFVFPDIGQDSLAIRLGVSQSDPLYQQKSRLLERLGLPTNGEFDLAHGDQPITPHLLTFLRIFVMNKETFSLWDVKKSLLNREELLEAVGSLPVDKAWDFFHLRLRLLLNAYPTTLQEDERLLESEDPDIPPRAKMAIQLRRVEKKILNNAVEYLVKLKFQNPENSNLSKNIMNASS